MRVQIFFEVIIFVSFRKIPDSGTARSYSSSIFNFLRKLHPVFNSDCTNSHFYQQCTKNLFPLHSCQRLLLLAFFIIAILTDVRRYLIVVLICISLMINIQKTKIMASGPITSWEIDRETVETVSDFIWGGSKITADGDCSHEIKRYLLLGRKVMTNLESILKSRDITLSTKVHLIKAMVFPVVMYGCESWTVKKAERRKFDASELWCWRKLLRVPWTAGRSNQSILKEILGVH